MDRSSKALRRLAATLGIAAVLFAQLAVAAYACTANAGAERGMPVAAAGVMHAGMPGCGEPEGGGNPNLCLQHCRQSVQTAPQGSVQAVSAIPVAILEPIQPAFSPGITVWSVVPERETSPPPLVRFSFLRI